MNRTTSRLQSIALVAVGQVQEESIATLLERLPVKFAGATCRLVEMENTAEKWRNPHTNQYHATRILEDLEKHTKQFQNDRLLGVTDLDLYVPGMNFVFGEEAHLPGRTAIISTYRLKGHTSYGEAELLPVRVVKEGMHELGHTLGLTHCKDPLCVMCFSNSLVDTDRKKEDYCEICSNKLGMNK